MSIEPQIRAWRDNCREMQFAHATRGNSVAAAFHAGAMEAFDRVLDTMRGPGRTARERVQSATDLWVGRGDRADLVRFYRHRGLRHSVAVTQHRGEPYTRPIDIR